MGWPQFNGDPEIENNRLKIVRKYLGASTLGTLMRERTIVTEKSRSDFIGHRFVLCAVNIHGLRGCRPQSDLHCGRRRPVVASARPNSEARDLIGLPLWFSPFWVDPGKVLH